MRPVKHGHRALGWLVAVVLTVVAPPAAAVDRPLPLAYRGGCVNAYTWDVWAPAILRVSRSSYVLYFSARHTNNLFCVGHATAGSLAGPFRPAAAPLACGTTDWNLDPQPVFSPQHGRSLLWRQDDAKHITGKIVTRRLNRSGTGWASSRDRPRTLLTGTARWEEGYTRHAGIGPIENPAMSYVPPAGGAAGHYVLTYSANRWETTNYATALARCSLTVGPCTKVTTAGPWVRRTSEPGNIVTTANFAGAGGLSFFTANRVVYAALAAWENNVADPVRGHRKTWVYRVLATPGGYRLVEP